MKTKDIIIKHIQEMDEKEAKKTLARLLLNYDKIGFGGYTKEECYKEYEDLYSNILTEDLFS